MKVEIVRHHEYNHEERKMHGSNRQTKIVIRKKVVG